jgi:hypothetical protein
MKLAQLKIKWLARLMLVLVLFAQGIVAANACVVPSSSAAQAFGLSQQGSDTPPCHQQKEIPNANACLTHCTQSDQISADQHHLPDMAPVIQISWLNRLPQALALSQAVFSETPVLNTGPPRTILFCTFLN